MTEPLKRGESVDTREGLEITRSTDGDHYKVRDLAAETTITLRVDQIGNLAELAGYEVNVAGRSR